MTIKDIKTDCQKLIDEGLSIEEIVDVQVRKSLSELSFTYDEAKKLIGEMKEGGAEVFFTAWQNKVNSFLKEE